MSNFGNKKEENMESESTIAVWPHVVILVYFQTAKAARNEHNKQIFFVSFLYYNTI
jgi:hypothetical protein